MDFNSQPPFPVTVSLLPPLERFVEELRDIWETHRLTNAGPKLERFEMRLREVLEVPGVLAFNTGGIALSAAIRALDLQGEIITTPFTFAATTHTAAMEGLTPVFCDVDPLNYNISPAAIERAITPRTAAILGVHVFGTPCAVEEIEAIAQRHGLKVIYDGAHAFGVHVNGRSIAHYGDVQMFSFNATKLLTTGEGGCVTFKDPALEPVLRRLRRWGMREEGDVTMPGWNGMMNEIQAALGLCNLEQLDRERKARRLLMDHYRTRLAAVPGIQLPVEPAGDHSALTYFVIRIKAEIFGASRDALLEWLTANRVLARRYFYPLTSCFPCYQGLPGSEPENLPVATAVAEEVLSLPLYGGLKDEGVAYICSLIEQFQQRPSR